MRCRFGAAASSPPSVSHRVFAGAGHSPATESTGRESRPENEWQRAEGRRPVAGGGSWRHETRSPSAPPTQHAHSHTRCCPRRPTEDTARVCRAEAAAPALALDPSAPDLASNTQEGNFRNSRESRMCPRQDPTSSKPNFKATGNITRNRAGMTFLGYRPATGARSWRSAAASHTPPGLALTAAHSAPSPSPPLHDPLPPLPLRGVC